MGLESGRRLCWRLEPREAPYLSSVRGTRVEKSADAVCQSSSGRTSFTWWRKGLYRW
jgi:hypothetical protein